MRSQQRLAGGGMALLVPRTVLRLASNVNWKENGDLVKKSTSVLAVAAVVGFSALTATPANAIVGAAYANCTEAAAAGAFNIPAGDPGYGAHLDSDSDGIGCERAAEGGTVDQAPANADQTPAIAVATAAYTNCTEAAAAGAFNIPAGDPRYGTHLDSDSDGIGCERAAEGETVVQAPVQTQAPVQAQIVKKPVGGAPTGIEQENDNGMGFLALGGLVVSAATGAVVVRRRMTSQA